MSLVDELRRRHGALWDRMVTHPFVTEMGDGSLPVEKFRAYFVQDYVFVRDLVSMTAQAMAKAPDFGSADRLNRFLTGILNPENDLFARFFGDLNVPEKEYTSAMASPTTRAFGDFLARVGLEGTFADALTVLYVTEGTYLDWGTALIRQGRDPENRVYGEWIALHGPDVLGELVGWMADYLDGAGLEGRMARVEELFVTALRYEYLFWEAAYRGEQWPDQ